MNIAQSAVSPAKLAAEWNKRFPVGTAVRYWIGRREGVGKIGRTRTSAQVVGDHTAVVWIEEQLGAVALSHIEPES